MEGVYRKHNNNYGYVNEYERNTPQAFSHFTYETSGKKLIVVDIQGIKGRLDNSLKHLGVDDFYTDPQIHILQEEDEERKKSWFQDSTFISPGNLGLRGIVKFFETHQCNEICRQMGLKQFVNDNNVSGNKKL